MDDRYGSDAPDIFQSLRHDAVHRHRYSDHTALCSLRVLPAQWFSNDDIRFLRVLVSFSSEGFRVGAPGQSTSCSESTGKAKYASHYRIETDRVGKIKGISADIGQPWGRREIRDE